MVAAASFAAAAAVLPISPPAQAAAPAKPFDLNGDGKRDIVVGTPAAFGHEGAVIVSISGKPKGQLLRKPVTQGDEKAEFGLAITSADFDRDGFADLAVGSPGDANAVVPGYGVAIGSVTIYRGSAAGLGAPVTRLLASDPGPSGSHRAFGTAVVAGDFDGDGWPDLAVGSPRDDAIPGGGSGVIVVLAGGPAGFSMSRATSVLRPSPTTDHFGELLASGDLNRDGRLDLVQGTGFVGRGQAGVVMGGPTGLRASLPFTAQGISSIAVGDVTGDGYDDVVLGEEYSPNASFGTAKGVPSGQVVLHRGSRAGMVLSSRPVLRQSSPGVPGSNESADRFGASVALTDLDRDGRLDVVVGAPGEDHRRGRVTVVRGASDGFARHGNFSFTQATDDVPGARRYGNRFGLSIAALDVAGSARRDLLVGAPGIGHVGSVTVLVVSAKNWHATGTRRLTTTRLGLAPVADYRFGAVIGSERRSCSLYDGSPAG